MRKNMRLEKAKNCPFIEQACLREDCEIFNERLNRCEIGLMAYNLFLLSDVLKRQLAETLEPAGAGMK